MHYLIGSRRSWRRSGATYGIVPVNATDEEAAEAAEATDAFRAQAAAEGLDLASRPYSHPERPAPPEAARAVPRQRASSRTAGARVMRQGCCSSTRPT